MRYFARGSVVLVLALGMAAALAAGDTAPCVSGLRSGQRPGPYSAIVVLGEQRGQSHCFICETADRPAVIVFARSLSEPLGKLAAGLDQALLDHKPADLRAWVTFLGEDESALSPQVLKWAKKHAMRSLPLAVFENSSGPPSYRLNADADVTVLLSVKQKVVRNFAFRSGELTPERIAEVLKALPAVVSAVKK
jgi:hypothetical protein